MAKSIYITMKDGTSRIFLHKGRAGGSWSQQIKYVEGFVIIIDEWGFKTSIPTADIKEIKEENYQP